MLQEHRAREKAQYQRACKCNSQLNMYVFISNLNSDKTPTFCNITDNWPIYFPGVGHVILLLVERGVFIYHLHVEVRKA